MRKMQVCVGSKKPIDWHPEDIKAAIRKSGISLRQLAVQHGYTESVIRKALRRPAVRVQSIVAEHLGIPPQKIWPSRYDELGQPLDRRRAGLRKSSRSFVVIESQKQEAV